MPIVKIADLVCGILKFAMGEGTTITEEMIKDFDEVSPNGSWNVFFQSGDDFDHYQDNIGSFREAADIAEKLKQSDGSGDISLVGATYHANDGSLSIQTFLDFESGDRWAELGSGKIHKKESKKMPIQRLANDLTPEEQTARQLQVELSNIMDVPTPITESDVYNFLVGRHIDDVDFRSLVHILLFDYSVDSMGNVENITNVDLTG